MKVKTIQIRNAVFWAMIVVFVILLNLIFNFGRFCRFRLPGSAMLYLAVALLVLAAATVVMTLKIKESRIRKFFFILTGASALGIPVFGILHNLVYFLCIKFGWVYWEEGGDEPVFFILALFVCPALFLVGAFGSIVILIRAGLRKNVEMIQ